MRLQMRCVDHQLVGLAALGGKGCEDAVEHAHPAPADEAVVDRFVRTVIGWSIAPALPVADHKDDPADDPPIIDPWHLV